MSAFVAQQRRHSAKVDAAHYQWQTEGGYFAGTEAMLVFGAARDGERLLEIGCGEGGNLFHVGPGPRRFGVDFSPAKAAFARRATGAHVTVADAHRLPFADGAFDVVLIRDVLHHVADPGAVLAAAWRVLRAGGRLIVVEPNRRAPLVLMQAALIAAERGLFKSTLERLRGLLCGAGFVITREASLQPWPVARVLLHPHMGLGRIGLGELAGKLFVQQLLAWSEFLAERVVPKQRWLYLRFDCEKP